MGELRYLKNVATLKLDTEKCVGCRMCVQVCPHGVFVMEDKKPRIADLDACMECGACVRNCEVGAIFVESGVGCVSAVIIGALKGTEPTCGCSKESCC